MLSDTTRSSPIFDVQMTLVTQVKVRKKAPGVTGGEWGETSAPFSSEEDEFCDDDFAAIDAAVAGPVCARVRARFASGTRAHVCLPQTRR